jgi:hypothetical protein
LQLGSISAPSAPNPSGARAAQAPAFEFAEPLQPVPAMGFWDRYGLWTVVAVVLVLVAYVYPLYTLLSHPRFGSPPFQPF